MRKVASLFAAVLIAAALTLAAARPASAETPPNPCDQYNLWVWQSISDNKRMGSCIYGYDEDRRRFWASTRLVSTSFWSGFHGCFYAQFYAFDGTLLTEVPTREFAHRMGVGADNIHTEYWNGVPPFVEPGLALNFTTRMVQYHC